MIDFIKSFIQKGEETASLALAFEENDGRLELKLKIAEIILRLRRKIKRPFGLLVVLGWRREWDRKYAATPDIRQNLFKENHFNIGDGSFEKSFEAVRETVDFDGAVLVSPEGIITGSGVYLENIHPKKVAKIIHPGHTEDLSAAFGFAKKVHTRHLTAIAGSYVLKHTTFFAVSEEYKSVRIMERGKIAWSTIKSEAKNSE